MFDRRAFATLVGSNARRRGGAVVGTLALLLVVAAVLATSVNRGGSRSDSAHDSALKRTAAQLLPSLDRANPKFPVIDSSLTSFQAWVYGSQQAFTAIIRTIRSPQVAQLQFTDPNVMPPQSLSLTAPGHPGVFVDAGIMAKVTANRQPQFASVQQGGRTYRAYLVALTTPAPLTTTGCTGVLEIYQPE